MTNSELAILSLVSESPRHGYEIEQIIEQRGMREWTEIGFSSIYYLLKRLEQSGWIKSDLETVAGRGPARRIYHITTAGQETWQEGALRLLAEPQHVTSPFLLGLSNLPGLPVDASVGALLKYSQQLEERLDYLLARLEAQRGAPAHVVAMFDFSRTMIRAELTWVRQWIQSNAG